MRVASLLLISIVVSQSPAAGVVRLVPQQRFEDSLAAGQSKILQIEIPAAHYARVMLTGSSGVVDGALTAPDGTIVLRTSSRTFGVGNIPFSLITASAAVFALHVTCSPAAACKYLAIVEDMRPADDEAALQLRGERALVNGELARLGRSDLREAVKFFAEAAASFRQTRERPGYGAAVALHGQALRTLEEHPQGIALYREALSLFREWGDRANEARTLRNIGELQRLLGQVDDAIASLTEALAVSRAANDRFAQGITLSSLGTLYDGLGEWQRALADKQEALAIWRAEKNQVEEALLMASLAVTYNRMGQSADAIRHMTEALSRMTDRPELELRIPLNNAGVIYATAGDFDTAISYYERALAITQRAKLQQAGTINNIGYALQAKGEVEAARGYYEKALPLFRAARDQVGESACLRNLARVRAHFGDRESAIALFEESLAISRRLRDRRNETLTLYQLALVERDAGKLAAASDHIEGAIGIAEGLRSALLNQSLRSAFLASVHRLYELGIDVRMRRHAAEPEAGHAAQAFALSERSKARALIDLLAESDLDIRGGVDAVLLDRERSLQRQQTAKADQIFTMLTARAAPARIEAAEKELAAIGEALADAQSRIRAASPRYAALTQSTGLAMAAVQRDVLDANTTLIAFALGEERSYAWFITQGGVQVVTLPPSREIETTARALYDAVNVPGANADASARAVEKMLLDPQRVKTPRVAIAADGVLHFVPFAMLLPQQEVVMVPSASAVHALRAERQTRARTGNGIAIFADPVFAADDPRIASTSRGAIEDARFGRLIGSRREARAIASFAPRGAVREMLGFEATRDAALSDQMQRYRIIHFATHGVWDSDRPELSGLAMSLVDQRGNPRNGFLRLGDVLRMKLSADLVTLSACQTALGKEIKGEGLVGITRGFMYAGTPRVVATLWKVDDAATAMLMEEFYKRLLGRKPMPAATALRDAQAAVRAQPRWRSPHYWAGFTLQGDWQ